jgi:hypothetical protein
MDDHTTSTLTVEWNTVTNASGYKVQWALTTTGFNGTLGKDYWEDVIVGQELDGHTISTNLTAGTTYHVRIIATGAGDYSDSPASTPVAMSTANPGDLVIAVPDDLSVVNATATSLTITWTPIANATGYTIQWAKSTGALGSGVEGVDYWEHTVSGQASKSYVVSNLPPGTEYFFRIKADTATDGFQGSGYSSPVKATTLPPFVITSTLEDVHILTVALSTGISSEDGVFQFKLASERDTTWITWKGSFTGNSISKPGLAAGTYDVRWVDAEGNVHLETVTVTASDDTVAVALKPKVKVGKKGTADATTASSITLTLTDHPKATAESNVRYVVTCFEKVGKVWTEVERISTTDDKVTFTGLKANSSYRYTITAFNANGNSKNAKGTKDVAVTVTAKTLKYAAVSKLKVASKDQSSVALTWLASKTNLPTGAETRYVILLYVGSNKTPTTLPETMEVIPSGTTGVTITGLSSGTKYKFAVRAIATVDGVDIESLDAKVSVKTL